MERYRTNLIALRCDEPGYTAPTTITAQPNDPQGSAPAANVARIAGRYYSSTTYRYYQVAQEGTNFSFRSEDGQESGTGSITVWPTHQNLTATVTGPAGTQAIRGVVTMSGTDRTQVFLLDWYGGYGNWQRNR